MPIELTDEDKKLLAATARTRQPGEPGVYVMERIAAAFIAAGIERAAKVFEQDPKPLITPKQAAAAIRELLK